MRNVSKSIWCVFLCMTFMQGQAYASKAECYMDPPKVEPKIEKAKGQNNVIIGYYITIIGETTIHHSDGSTEPYKNSTETKFVTKSDYEDVEANEWMAADIEAFSVNFTSEVEEKLKNCHPQE